MDITERIGKLRDARDRAVGAVLLLSYDGVISEGRALELLGMSVIEQREEYNRISRGRGSDADVLVPSVLMGENQPCE